MGYACRCPALNHVYFLIELLFVVNSVIFHLYLADWVVEHRLDNAGPEEA